MSLSREIQKSIFVSIRSGRVMPNEHDAKLAHRIGSRFLRNKIFEQSSFLNKNSVEKNDLKFHRNEIIRVLDRVRKKQTRGRK